MSLAKFQKGLYRYYGEIQDKENNPRLSFPDFVDMLAKYKERKDKYLVYVGYSKKDKEKKNIIYVGTTIQYPLSRWYYHKTHGKDLVFVEYKRFGNEKDMLDLEFELIQKHHPSCNTITSRRQNYNVALTAEELESRKGNPEWCQCCYRRRVNKGYTYCMYCEKELRRDIRSTLNSLLRKR